MTQTSTTEHIIDATDKAVGRVATEVVRLLRGKDSVAYQPHILSKNVVRVQHVSHLKMTGKKDVQKRYFRYSGYPGGITSRSVRELQQQKPGEILRLAVLGMLPDNRLRKQMIKRLIIE